MLVDAIEGLAGSCCAERETRSQPCWVDQVSGAPTEFGQDD
jgi:hypothetical protein